MYHISMFQQLNCCDTASHHLCGKGKLSLEKDSPLVKHKKLSKFVSSAIFYVIF